MKQRLHSIDEIILFSAVKYKIKQNGIKPPS